MISEHLLSCLGLPKRFSLGGILVGVWLLASFIVATVYKGNLKAALIAPKINIPFRSFQELSHYQDTPPMVFNEVNFHTASLVIVFLHPIWVCAPLQCPLVIGCVFVVVIVS